LLEYSFPKGFPSEALEKRRSQLFQVTEQLIAEGQTSLQEEQLMDHLVQMNMGEIRTRAHMLLLSPIIYTLTPESAKARVRNILEGLVTDEIRHISYTARFIESWCRSGDSKRLLALYRQRLHDFHRLTIDQTEASVTAYGQGRFPDLLEI
jgi:hypothetical protein